MLSFVLPLLLIPPSLEVILSLHVAHYVTLSNTLLSSQLTFDSLLAASPEAGVYQQLEQCDTCGRKFNKQALERHIKVGPCRCR